MKKIIISPPFGNYLSFNWATSVKGTLTLEPRTGLIKQVIKTLRPIKGGWINKIGLKNPGIKSIKDFSENEIYSVIGFDDYEWHTIRNIIPENMIVEVNLGCPNTKETYTISPYALERYLKKFKRVIVKLPPAPAVYTLAKRVHEVGGRYIHISNTIPVPGGGESGKRLKELNLRSIRVIKGVFPDMHIVGGGGIHSFEDLKDYESVGAEFFSVSTICFNPIKFLNFNRDVRQLVL